MARNSFYVILQTSCNLQPQKGDLPFIFHAQILQNLDEMMAKNLCIFVEIWVPWKVVPLCL